MEGPQMVEAWKEWLAGAEGQKCSNPNTIGQGERWRAYLENRLQMAFYAGIEAEESSNQRREVQP